MATGGGAPSCSDSSLVKEKQQQTNMPIVYNLEDLKWITGHLLPKAIVENANYIFVQEAEATANILKTKTQPVLLKIRTALRNRAKYIAPPHILKQASKGGVKSKLIADIVKIGPYCVSDPSSLGLATPKRTRPVPLFTVLDSPAAADGAAAPPEPEPSLHHLWSRLL